MTEEKSVERSSLLISEPKTFAYWWSFVPVLPESRESWDYQVLKRQWADHTMNCLTHEAGYWKLSSSRSFYVQGREDHVTTVLFHIWALFPDVRWVGRLLDLWDIPHGAIAKARWSYSWEQKLDKSARLITDIVLCYEDDDGQGVIVIEAKRRGGALQEKDMNGGVRYLDLPSIRPFQRKQCVYLVDARDLEKIRGKLPTGTPIASWQSMGRLQRDCIHDLSINDSDVWRAQAYAAQHYAELGMSLGELDVLDSCEFTGTRERYSIFREKRLPSSVARFFLGSEAAFCSHKGQMPEAPMAWLSNEPSFVDVVERRSQTTRDREKPLWRLPSGDR